MFCPNCGAQNDDAANICTKCGFTLKQASAPKFKGTMLMMNAPPVAPRPGAPGPGAAPPGAPDAAAQPPPGGAPPAGPSAPGGAPKPKLKGTMIGVAPPSLGSNNPGAARGGPGGPGGPSPYGSPPGGGGAPGQYGSPPGQGVSAPTAPMAAVPQPPATPASPQQPGPAQQPGQYGVNPLGGTMVADASSMGQGGFPGGAPQQQPYGGPQPGQPGVGAPGQAPGFGQDAGIGQPPPGFGGDPGQAPPGYAPPQASPGFDAQGQMLAGGMGGMTAPGAGHIGAPGAAMVPQQEPYYGGNEPVPGTVGGNNPVVTVLLIVLTCGVYGIYLLMKNKKQA